MVSSSERRNLVSWYQDCAQPGAIVAKSAAGLIIIGVIAFSGTNAADNPSVGAGSERNDHLQARAIESAREFGGTVEEGAAGSDDETAADAASTAQRVLTSSPAASGH